MSPYKKYFPEHLKVFFCASTVLFLWCVLFLHIFEKNVTSSTEGWFIWLLKYFVMFTLTMTIKKQLQNVQNKMALNDFDIKLRIS